MEDEQQLELIEECNVLVGIEIDKCNKILFSFCFSVAN